MNNGQSAHPAADSKQQHSLSATLPCLSSPQASPRASVREAFLRALLPVLPDYGVQLLASADGKLATLCSLLSQDDLSALLAQPQAEQLLDAVYHKHQQQQQQNQQQHHSATCSADSPLASTDAGHAASAVCKYRFRRQPVCAQCGDSGHIEGNCTTSYCSSCKQWGHKPGLECQRVCRHCGRPHVIPPSKLGTGCAPKCSHCSLYGHKTRSCPTALCKNCKCYGHISLDCSHAAAAIIVVKNTRSSSAQSSTAIATGHRQPSTAAPGPGASSLDGFSRPCHSKSSHNASSASRSASVESRPAYIADVHDSIQRAVSPRMPAAGDALLGTGGAIRNSSCSSGVVFSNFGTGSACHNSVGTSTDTQSVLQEVRSDKSSALSGFNSNAASISSVASTTERGCGHTAGSSTGEPAHLVRTSNLKAPAHAFEPGVPATQCRSYTDRVEPCSSFTECCKDGNVVTGSSTSSGGCSAKPASSHHSSAAAGLQSLPQHTTSSRLHAEEKPASSRGSPINSSPRSQPQQSKDFSALSQLECGQLAIMLSKRNAPVHGPKRMLVRRLTALMLQEQPAQHSAAAVESTPGAADTVSEAGSRPSISPLANKKPKEFSYNGKQYRFVGPLVCTQCGGKGHFATDCTTPHCSRCNKYGHITGTCSQACQQCGLKHCAKHMKAGLCKEIGTQFCDGCKLWGHKKVECPSTQCVQCGLWGHATEKCNVAKAAAVQRSAGNTLGSGSSATAVAHLVADSYGQLADSHQASAAASVAKPSIAAQPAATAASARAAVGFAATSSSAAAADVAAAGNSVAITALIAAEGVAAGHTATAAFEEGCELSALSINSKDVATAAAVQDLVGGTEHQALAAVAIIQSDGNTAVQHNANGTVQPMPASETEACDNDSVAAHEQHESLQQEDSAAKRKRQGLKKKHREVITAHDDVPLAAAAADRGMPSASEALLAIATVADAADGVQCAASDSVFDSSAVLASLPLTVTSGASDVDTPMEVWSAVESAAQSTAVAGNAGAVAVASIPTATETANAAVVGGTAEAAATPAEAAQSAAVEMAKAAEFAVVQLNNSSTCNLPTADVLGVTAQTADEPEAGELRVDEVAPTMFLVRKKQRGIKEGQRSPQALSSASSPAAAAAVAEAAIPSLLTVTDSSATALSTSDNALAPSAIPAASSALTSAAALVAAADRATNDLSMPVGGTTTPALPAAQSASSTAAVLPGEADAVPVPSQPDLLPGKPAAQAASYAGTACGVASVASSRASYSSSTSMPAVESAAAPAQAAAVDGPFKFYGPVVCSRCGMTGHHTRQFCSVQHCSECNRYGHSTSNCASACRTCGRRHRGKHCNELECFQCGLYGHRACSCPMTQCWKCKYYGHIAKACKACRVCQQHECMHLTCKTGEPIQPPRQPPPPSKQQQQQGCTDAAAVARHALQDAAHSRSRSAALVHNLFSHDMADYAMELMACKHKLELLAGLSEDDLVSILAQPEPQAVLDAVYDHHHTAEQRQQGEGVNAALQVAKKEFNCSISRSVASNEGGMSHSHNRSSSSSSSSNHAGDTVTLEAMQLQPDKEEKPQQLGPGTMLQDDGGVAGSGLGCAHVVGSSSSAYEEEELNEMLSLLGV